MLASGCDFVILPHSTTTTCATCGDAFPSGAGDGGPGPIYPDAVGPDTVGQVDLPVPVDASDNVNVTVWGPGTQSQISGGPYPVVLLTPAAATDRTAGASQYAQYAQRLASYGIVVVEQRPRDPSNVTQSRSDALTVLAWFRKPTTPQGEQLAATMNLARLGVLGHAQGGSLSILIAASTPTQGVFAIDPVDTVNMPGAVSAVATLTIQGGAPLGLLGASQSQTGMPVCAPPALGYTALRMQAKSVIPIMFQAAGQMQFVDDLASCAACQACPQGVAVTATVHETAVKYSAAYFLWTLLGYSAAKAYLTGLPFQADVASGLVTSP